MGTTMHIDRLDHLVLTVKDIDATCAFYSAVLGMRVVSLGNGRTAPLPEVMRHFESAGVRVEQGPVKRVGATGPIVSVYVRDPDLNLIEVSNCERP